MNKWLSSIGVAGMTAVIAWPAMAQVDWYQQGQQALAKKNRRGTLPGRENRYDGGT